MKMEARLLIGVGSFFAITDILYWFWGYHYLASESPLPMTSAETLVARMPPAARADLMEWFPKGKPVKLLAAVLAREYDLQATLAHWPTALTDDRPYNEYYLLRRWFPGLAPHLN